MTEETPGKPALPHPADRILAGLVNQIVPIQPRFVDGIYVTGSLPMNDFHSGKSDIDFLVLCAALPDRKMAAQLTHIHKVIQKQFPKPDLSGSYVASESMQTGDIHHIKALTWHGGIMRYGDLEMAPVCQQELKTVALTLYGEQAETLPIDVKPDVLCRFLHDNINSYWRKWLKRYSVLLNRGILLWAFPRLTEWAVLGVARQLCTLQTGNIVSKTEAGRYCLEHLPEQYHSVISEAIKIRQDNRTFPLVGSYAIKPSFDRLTKTIGCVHFIITTFNEIYRGRFQASTA